LNRRSDQTITWDKKCTGCGCRFTDSMTSLMGSFPCPVRLFKVPTGLCPECQKENKDRWEKLRLACHLNWNFETVREHFLEHPPVKGQEMIVYDSSWNANTYALVTVEVPEHTRQKRIVIASYSNGYNGQSFYRTGQNCYAPKGQVRLLPYHQEIGARIKSNDGHEISLQLREIAEIFGLKCESTPNITHKIP